MTGTNLTNSRTPAPIVKEAELETVRRWLNARPDLLLAIAKRHTTNPLLNPLPSASASASTSASSSSSTSTSTTHAMPTLKLDVPTGGLTADKIRIKISTRARNVEVDIPLPASSSSDGGGGPQSNGNGNGNEGLGKGGFGRKIERLGKEALSHFDVQLVRRDRTRSRTQISGGWAIPASGFIAAAFHLVIEPLILVPRLQRHSVPLIPTLLYMGTVLLIGYGGIDALNRAVIQERVRLIQTYSTETKKGK